MGICKCKKRTDLFCFVHKKAVCESCICTDHKTCVVKTYVEWLTDSDYDPPTCGICRGALSEDNVIRLVCLDMFHPECLDVHCASLPPHTAKAGYSCPVCWKPIFPPDLDNPLVQQINDHLSRSPWAATLITGKIPTPPELSSGEKQREEERGANRDSDTNPGPSAPSGATSTKRGAGATPAPVEQTDSRDYGIASRKTAGAREQSITIDDEPEEDKYKKRSVMQLFTALGIVAPSKPAKGSRQTRIRFDKRRILVIIALISCLVTVIMLGMSMTSEIETEVPAE